ncbi:MAG: hypothetical protein WBB23_24265 [Desulforhopalus sp.]
MGLWATITGAGNTDEPIGKVKVTDDFLPSPEELSLKKETGKAGKKAEKKCSKM